MSANISHQLDPLPISLNSNTTQHNETQDMRFTATWLRLAITMTTIASMITTVKEWEYVNCEYKHKLNVCMYIYVSICKGNRKVSYKEHLNSE